ncbi:MAG: FHA domain-containing protein [Myxococcaceae bacterium]|nr:FHA domain-containing protein [Myxococcaceae bacterium]
MGLPAFMLSILHRQQTLLQEDFVARYPTDWLVWEPGPWQPPRSALQSNLEATMAPKRQESRPVGNDAICFQLKPPKDGGLIRVGRATSNDVVINDLTASREQFSLRFEKGRWFLVSPQGQLTVDGKSVSDLVELKSGSRVVLGDVALVVVSAEEMAARAGAFRPTP